MLLAPEAPDAAGRVACIDAASGAEWTYGALHDAVRAFAAVLAAGPRGVGALLCRNDVPTVVAYLAALEARVPLLLLDGALDPEAQAGLDGVYAFDLVLGSAPDGVAEPLRGGEARAPAAAHEPWLWRRASGERAAPHAELALLLSTSGSTGSPKLVRLSARNVRSNADAIREALAIVPGDRAITTLPLHYSYGLSVLNSHLRAGATVVLTGESIVSPAFWAACREHACTSFAGVPYTYQILARLGLQRVNAPSLRTFTQAGGRLHDDLVARFHREVSERGGRFHVMYGQTEATARIAVLPAGALPEKLGAAGRALPNGALRILRDDGTALPTGEVGEIVYEGPNVMLGYATTRDELALGDEQRGRLSTGDLGFLDADGVLFVTGRLKRIAKVFGLRVSLEEIEAMTRRHAPSAAVAGDDRVIVFWETASEERFGEWAQELAGRLRVNHRGFEFRRVDALPVTTSGKIDYPRLQATA